MTDPHALDNARYDLGEELASRVEELSVMQRIDRELNSESYYDLSANWSVTEKASVTLGINNVLDDNPAISATVATLRSARAQGKEREQPEILPPAYNYNSTLFRQVKPGSNVINFDLEVASLKSGNKAGEK
mgnify:CR=1 FL=1